MTSHIPNGPRFTLVFTAILLIGIGVAYSGSFWIGFYFDGVFGITENAGIRSLRNIPSFFVDPSATWNVAVRRAPDDLRPLVLTTFAINYAISALHPWSYHALNLILHFIASMLVFVIVRDHLWWPASDRGPDGQARIAAAAAALVFALAPLNTQPVNYIWARSALLCVALYLSAFLGYLRRRWVLGSVLFVLALLTKAIAVTLPAVIVLHDVVYRDRERYPTLGLWLRSWRRLAVPVLLTSALDAVYLFLYRALLAPPWGGETTLYLATPWVWFMTQWSALLYYVRLFVWPDSLSVDHGFPLTTSFVQPRAWGSLLVLLLWVVLALLAFKRYPQVTFASAWFFITLAPESSFIPLTQTINDHRPYIASSLGLSVLLVWLLWQGAKRLAPSALHLAFSVGCLVLLIPAVVVDRHQTWIWGDETRMWQHAVLTSPNSAIALANTATGLIAQGNLRDARGYLERAANLDPNVRDFALMNLALLEVQDGRLDEALRQAQEAVRFRPDTFETYGVLAFVLGKMGRTADADAAVRTALERYPPSDPQTWADMVRMLHAPTPLQEEKTMSVGLDALYKRGDPLAAATEFRRVLALNPTHYGATFQLATALDRAGKPSEARPLWEKVLKMAQDYKDQPTQDAARQRLAQQP